MKENNRVDWLTTGRGYNWILHIQLKFWFFKTMTILQHPSFDIISCLSTQCLQLPLKAIKSQRETRVCASKIPRQTQSSQQWPSNDGVVTPGAEIMNPSEGGGGSNSRRHAAGSYGVQRASIHMRARTHKRTQARGRGWIGTDRKWQWIQLKYIM